MSRLFNNVISQFKFSIKLTLASNVHQEIDKCREYWNINPYLKSMRTFISLQRCQFSHFACFSFSHFRKNSMWNSQIRRVNFKLLDSIGNRAAVCALMCDWKKHGTTNEATKINYDVIIIAYFSLLFRWKHARECWLEKKSFAVQMKQYNQKFYLNDYFYFSKKLK